VEVFEADVHGSCDEHFEPVRAAFERNFRDAGELGASLCVTYRGEVVVDLHGGFRDIAGAQPWERDTLVMVWSSTKGALVVCAHVLVAQGLLDLDQPVTHYWPELAAGEEVTVAMLLNHQAGLAGLSGPPPPGAVFEFDEMTARVGAELPLWRPGTRHGYHSFTFGWLVGEVVHRVTGELPGTFFARQVAGPLGLDFWIGLPPGEDRRVAQTQLAPRGASPFMRALELGEPVQVAVERSWGEFADAGVSDSREARAGNVPAVNGIANGRALALLYRPLANREPIGEAVIPPEVWHRMSSVESAGGVDAVTLEATRFSSGFMKPGQARSWDAPKLPESAFGHNGMGGSFGFADPARRLSVGYAMNRHAPYGDQRRGQRLIDAVYRSLPAAAGSQPSREEIDE
jgi:CubicO group peptidase (beta-lactamase class C family)